jgi:hypothetical protein
MLTGIRRWRQRRAQARNNQDFERGFAFAMTEHYLHAIPVEAIDAMCDGYEPLAFDYGVREACRLIKEK